MNRNTRGWMYLLFAVLIMCITLGYAYLYTELDINGTTNITSANWSIYWDNIQFGSNNVTDVTTPATISSGLTEVTFNVNFQQPGDTYEFTVDAVNDGSIDAMIGDLSQRVYASNGTTPKPLPDYLEYTVTYSNGVELEQNHLLAHNTTETYKVRVYYKEDITASQLPSTDDNYVFKFGTSYKQANSSAIARANSVFESHSWSTIIANVQNNNIALYNIGDTKSVDLGSLGTHTLRIANKSTPSDCSTTGFSQTACGFVLEFSDNITTRKLTTTDSNSGGWPSSSMRNYVNSTIYNALPDDLKNGIIDTTVVSGHGNNDSNNFTSVDKIYLLSTKEIWGKEGTSNVVTYDTAEIETRQLDYYSGIGVTTSNYSGAIKQYNSSDIEWWLRTAISYLPYDYYLVTNSGKPAYHSSVAVDGVSPAFRIG